MNTKPEPQSPLEVIFDEGQRVIQVQPQLSESRQNADNQPEVDETGNSLDLHLDISLPEIVLESPLKAVASASAEKYQNMESASPDGTYKASELLNSDERELLKDLQCFEDSEKN